MDPFLIPNNHINFWEKNPWVTSILSFPLTQNCMFKTNNVLSHLASENLKLLLFSILTPQMFGTLQGNVQMTAHLQCGEKGQEP